MWSQILCVLSLAALSQTEPTSPGIDRTLSDGVQSLGYKVVYGDEDLTMINEVVSDIEKGNKLKKADIHDSMPPLPAQDVKCLMSVDRYCSKEMGAMKSVLIQALKEDCKECTKDEKEKAGKIVASLMAHDPVAWKMFLTRYDTQQRAQRILG